MREIIVAFFFAILPFAHASPAFPDPSRVISDIKSHLTGAESKIEGFVGSELSGAPGYVASGVANFFQDFPTGDKVKSSLGLDDSQIAALPTQVLNVP